MSVKRKRDPTFVASEKMALIDIVERHFDIVESKKTDAVSTAAKNIEWRKIALEFNAMSSINPREWTVLKNCWENLKKRAKNQHTLRNQHYIGTASGECSNEETQSTTVKSFVSDPDADALMDNDSASILPLQTDNAAATNLPLDWSMYTPNMLRGIRNPLLFPSPSPSPDVHPQQQMAQSTSLSDTPSRSARASASRRRPIISSDTQNLTQERLNIMLKANTHAEEEHDVQMRILQLKEEQERHILEVEKLKVLQETIKLEILKIQLKKLQE